MRNQIKSILIGSVGSSKATLEEMLKFNFPIDLVFSLDEEKSNNVSGYYPLHVLAKEHNIPYKVFKKINEQDNIDLIKEVNPDYIFVIGLSQLVCKEIINSAKIGAIGFHPTPLPKFRGRAALAWQILLGIKESKCSLFFIDEGIDSGDVIGQELYVIGDNDYAADVILKCQSAYRSLLRKTFPLLLTGDVVRIKQDESEATYLLKRTSEDGRINWNEPCEKIHRLIRAVSIPYPGAFSYYNGSSKVIFWEADFMENTKYFGIPGQIAKRSENSMDIVCVDGLLRVYNYANLESVAIREGNKFK